MENESVTVRAEEPTAEPTPEAPGRDGRGTAGVTEESTGSSTAECGRIEGVVIGRLVRGGPAAEVLVDYPGNPTGGPLSALSTAETGPDDVGRDVALAFQGGDPGKPVMLGFLEHPRPLEVEVDAEEGGGRSEPGDAEAGEVEAPEADRREGEAAIPVDGTSDGGLEARVDDERLVLSAEKEIVLRCGRSSITLTRAGKVLIRGRYLLSRSAGVNRIKGGSVQIN